MSPGLAFEYHHVPVLLHLRGGACDFTITCPACYALNLPWSAPMTAMAFDRLLFDQLPEHWQRSNLPDEDYEDLVDSYFRLLEAEEDWGLQAVGILYNEGEGFNQSPSEDDSTSLSPFTPPLSPILRQVDPPSSQESESSQQQLDVSRDLPQQGETRGQLEQSLCSMQEQADRTDLRIHEMMIRVDLISRMAETMQTMLMTTILECDQPSDETSVQ